MCRAGSFCPGCVAGYPKRLRMFANLALTDPIAAAKELERGVQKLGCLTIHTVAQWPARGF